MTFSKEKAFWCALIVVLVLTGVAAYCGLLKIQPKTQNERLSVGKDKYSTKFLQNGHSFDLQQAESQNKQETKQNDNDLESNLVPFLDKTGLNMKHYIEDNCLKARYSDCRILLQRYNELKWIAQNNLTQCAIVRMAENNCIEVDGLDCKKFDCSLPNDEKSTKNSSKFGFWFQDYFKLPKENMVSLSPHFKRYTCIRKDEKIGLEDGGICIRNLYILKGVSNELLELDFVKSSLAKNLRNYSVVPKVVAQKIDVKNLPYGTQITTEYGKNPGLYPNRNVYVLPSPLTLTKETVSWMRKNYWMSTTICYAFGIRKLNAIEIDALPEDPHLGCFYDKSGKPIQKKEDIVWTFGLNFGRFWNVSEFISADALTYVGNFRDYVCVKNTKSVKKVPNGWSKVHDNLFLKNNGSRVVYLSDVKCEEFETNPLFKKYLNDGGFVILACMDQESKMNHHQILDYNLYSKETKKLPLKFKDILLKSQFGEEFFVRYGEIPMGKTKLMIGLRTCEYFLKERNEDLKFKELGLDCLVENGKTVLIKV